MQKIRVILCDDHAIVRVGIKQIIDNEDDMQVIAEFETGEDLLNASKKLKGDVVLLDISLPGKSGVDILKLLISNDFHIPVIMLSMYPEDQYALQMLKAGAAGYLNKDSAPDILLGAIRTVAAGKSYFSAAITQKLLEEKEKDKNKLPHEKLSFREREVLDLIGRGKSPSEIAHELGLSIKTVSTYRSRILEKMELESNADLIKYLVEHHLLDESSM